MANNIWHLRICVRYLIQCGLELGTNDHIEGEHILMVQICSSSTTIPICTITKGGQRREILPSCTNIYIARPKKAIPCSRHVYRSNVHFCKRKRPFYSILTLVTLVQWRPLLVDACSMQHIFLITYTNHVFTQENTTK